MYLCISDYKKQLLFDLINTMDSIFLGLRLGDILVLILIVILFLRLRKNESKSSSREEKIEQIIGDKINSSHQDLFNKSIETLTNLTKSTNESARNETNEDLENKKKLIDEKIAGVTDTLKEVKRTLKKYEEGSSTRHTELSAGIDNVSTQTNKLAETTTDLNKILNSSQARGQWGERMAEDILQIAGFEEGYQYKKGDPVETSELKQIIPDFTFLLPDGLRLNMDVKFPLDNYAKYVSAESDDEQKRYQKAFMKDVKGHIVAIANKAYIDPAGGTIDVGLMFIPNEGVYEFIVRNGDGVIDGALKKKIIVCSPLTMLAILAVIRQSMESFALSKTSGEILKVLDGFAHQWEAFKKHMDLTEKQLGTFRSSFNTLKTTRSNQLERSMSKVKELRESRGEALPESVKLIPEE